MSHILDDLGLFLRRKSREPFGKTLRGKKFAVSSSEVPPACGVKKIGVGHETNHFALPGQENQVAELESQSVYGYQQTHLMMVESH